MKISPKPQKECERLPQRILRVREKPGEKRQSEGETFFFETLSPLLVH